jgi:mannose-6-phosphate isomerase-like protein (cupin superfamily)
MIIRQLGQSTPFTTMDGSTIRSLLDRSNAPVRNQSLAEATLPPGGRTRPHRHRESEEFYYVLEGEGVMTIETEEAPVGPGDAILIPPGARHSLRNTGAATLRILCCCAPPYAHEDTILD